MKTYQEVYQYMQRIADINSANAILSWDKEVNLPTGSAERRGKQMATLSSISHQKLTDPALKNAIDNLLENDRLSDSEKINLIRLKRDVEMETKFTTEFVEKLSLAVSAGYHAWAEARQKSDFNIYSDKLDRLIQLKKEAAETLGYEDHPYDALADQYEPGMTVKTLDRVFLQVKNDLVPLIHEFAGKDQPDDQFLKQFFNEKEQWHFGLRILREMGYDFNKGRQDKSTHPFSISFGPEDVRVTTRVDENNYAYMLWSTMHEGGHALYEQGLPPDQYGMPLGQAASLAIHESQSRLWENHVGRSREFWNHYYPILQETFKAQLKNISPESFYRGINKVAPNLIRTEADELHYHLHVLIRYEIEKEMITGDLKTSELPEAWNQRYAEYLRVKVPNDTEGVLQDVHWAFGSIGYFPTYSLGSFYAAQFYSKAEESISGLKSQIEEGEMLHLLSWLRENIHCQGRRYYAEDLCEKVTGERLNLDYFLNYVKAKFSDITG